MDLRVGETRDGSFVRWGLSLQRRVGNLSPDGRGRQWGFAFPDSFPRGLDMGVCNALAGRNVQLSLSRRLQAAFLCMDNGSFYGTQECGATPPVERALGDLFSPRAFYAFATCPSSGRIYAGFGYEVIGQVTYNDVLYSDDGVLTWHDRALSDIGDIWQCGFVCGGGNCSSSALITPILAPANAAAIHSRATFFSATSGSRIWTAHSGVTLRARTLRRRSPRASAMRSTFGKPTHDGNVATQDMCESSNNGEAWHVSHTANGAYHACA